MRLLTVLLLSLGLTGCFVCTKQPLKTEDKPVAAPEQPKPAAPVKTPFKHSVVTGAAIFEFDTINITATNEEAFNDICGYLKENPTAKLVIEGHTDNIGDYEHNKVLGQKRADLIAKKFTDAGVTNKIEAVSYGEQKPLAPNDTEEGQAANRRVDIYVMTQEVEEGSL